jgi:hypothetical protein
VLLILTVVLVMALAVNLVKSVAVGDDLQLPCAAEVLMPGNTVVMGTCTHFNRISSGWVRLEVNGKWYSMNEWRVVLKEE